MEKLHQGPVLHIAVKGNDDKVSMFQCGKILQRQFENNINSYARHKNATSTRSVSTFYAFMTLLINNAH